MLPRPEYPRPQFVRNHWLNLNGEWKFAFDDANVGIQQKWYLYPNFSSQIVVPFSFQSPLSGIGDSDFHDVIWYHRDFTIPEAWSAKRVVLHFGAVDYRAWIWVNGQLVCTHEGGHTPFQADMTDVLHDGANQLVVRVEDVSGDLEQPRGKQFWEKQPQSIFYTRTSGIWQTVWLEAVPQRSVQKLKMTPDVDREWVRLECWVTPSSAIKVLDVEIQYQGRIVDCSRHEIASQKSKISFDVVLDDFHPDQLWSPEHPNLFDVILKLEDQNETVDEVRSYFGMRKIAVQDGQIRLNNQPYYMKLILDQGYFPDGLLTPPSDVAIRNDIEQTKAMGFNGARKHQKIEDPRYLYWADHLGLLVWGEMANSHDFSDTSISRITAEWQAAIDRDYNHPCVVAWVPLNESWGVPTLGTDERQPHHALSLYHLTKSLDSTRLVISNDGWEHTHSDLCTVHDYDNHPDKMIERYQSIESVFANPSTKFPIYVAGFENKAAPIFISEFGGIAYRQSEWEGWGYSAAQGEAEFIEHYHRVISTVLNLPLVQGFCYTQLTDVEQEINGLLTYDRRPKVDPAIIRAINERQPMEVIAQMHKPELRSA